jgi:formylglycine-generating enzyme required for sulfatase activity
MVRMPEGYSIDSTEVTRCQYQQWLSTNPPVANQDAWCAWNDSYKPSCQWPPGSMGNYPVVCVNWCDAYAYCKGVGKRLCGRIGGGANGFRDGEDATKSQWFSACSSGGTNAYPYGDTYDPQACNGRDKAGSGCATGACTSIEVGSSSSCQASGSRAGVFDLSGNVSEFEDACLTTSGLNDLCLLRGGTFGHFGGALRCDFFDDTYRYISTNDHIGFRCCSDP